MTSSNDSLFGLAANLQSMENNLNEFIFHCALRLSSMTDSRVFVLMDNPNDPGGRRFAGSRELVDEYAGHGLKLRLGTDVEMELNPDNPPVRMKQRQIQQQIRQQEQVLRQESLGSLPQHPSPFDFGGNGSMKRGWSKSGSGINDESTSSSTPKRRRNKDVASREVVGESSTVAECKKEVEEFLIDSDSEDGVTNQANGSHSAFNGHASSAPYPDSLDNDSSVFNPILPTGDPFACSFDEYPSQKVGLDIPNLMMKERALSGVSNCPAAFVKGSVENKLLASTMYDAGKAMTMTNPFPLGSEAFRGDFQRRLRIYIDSFSQFTRVDVTPETTALVTNNVKEYSPEAFLKMNMRNGHKRAIKALQKEQKRNEET